MQKAVVTRSKDQIQPESDESWRDLEQIARVEVTGEDPSFPVEEAFRPSGTGWRASESGEQRIRLLFPEPISLRRIHLRFEEQERQRTQQFTLRWFGKNAQPNEIVRQQWNFSPSGSTTEIEDLAVNLNGVAGLELTIIPDISGGDAIATLASLRLR